MAGGLAIWIDVARDLEVAAGHAEDAARRAKRFEDSNPVDLEVAPTDRELAVAVLLHHCYGALENVLERLLRVIDGVTPSGHLSHAALIEAAATPRPDVRPAILSPQTATRMHRLRAFRHAFRHAYGQYDYLLAAENVDIAVELVASFRREITAFAEARGIKPRD